MCTHYTNLSYTNPFYTDTLAAIHELCMTLANYALGKWKRIECDLEALFFQITFTFAITSNIAQVKQLAYYFSEFILAATPS